MNVLRETQAFYCDLVVDLGSLPMRTPLGEGVDDRIFIDDDEIEYDEEDVEEDDDEDEKDKEDDDEMDILQEDKHYSQLTKRRAHGKNLNLYDKFQKNGSRPLPVEFDYSSNQFRSVGENDQLFIRLISNGLIDMLLFTIGVGKIYLHYLDMQQYHNTGHWDGINLGIQSDCANRLKQLYGSYYGTQSSAQRRYDEVKETGVAQHFERWRDMHFKGSSGGILRWPNNIR
ncbi:hypothetical protein R6Q57_015994 [Mikania cordata]